jgi:hypothetical protein
MEREKGRGAVLIVALKIRRHRDLAERAWLLVANVTARIVCW